MIEVTRVEQKIILDYVWSGSTSAETGPLRMNWRGFPAVGTSNIKDQSDKDLWLEGRHSQLSETQDMDILSHGYELVIHYFFIIINLFFY